MKHMLLILILMSSFSVQSQQKVITNPFPDELIGKWVPQSQSNQGKPGVAIESISFFADGKINIDTRKSKIVQGYKAVKENAGYDIQLTELINGSPVANFKVQYVTDSTMGVTMKGKEYVRNLVLKKTKLNKYKVIPLKNS